MILLTLLVVWAVGAVAVIMITTGDLPGCIGVGLTWPLLLLTVVCALVWAGTWVVASLPFKAFDMWILEPRRLRKEFDEIMRADKEREANK